MLTRAGVPHLLLEASAWPGGRARTRHHPSSLVPIELGAELVHGPAPRTRALARAYGLSLTRFVGGHWSRGTNGKLTERADYEEKLEGALSKILATAAEGREDVSFAAAAAAARLSPADRALAASFVEGFQGGAADDTSLAWLRCIGAEGPGPMVRIAGGYGSLVAALAHEAGTSLRLGHRVTRVRWSRGEVQIGGRDAVGESFSVSARGALFGLPLDVLATAGYSETSLSIEPSLPRAQLVALGQLGMGNVVKVLLRFDTAFWAKGDRASASFFHTAQGAFPTFWTALPAEEPLIVAWAGGPHALALAELPEHERVGLAVDAFADCLGRDRALVRRSLVTSFAHDWSHDGLARGAYSYARVGGATASKRASRAVQGTLFFAGEHTAEAAAMGTVEGALASGERAAEEAIQALGGVTTAMPRSPRSP